MVKGKPALITLDYLIDSSLDKENDDINRHEDSLR